MLIKEMNALNVKVIFSCGNILISFGQRPWKFSILIKFFCLNEPKYVICNLEQGFTSVLKEGFGTCKLTFKIDSGLELTQSVFGKYITFVQGIFP